MKNAIWAVCLIVIALIGSVAIGRFASMLKALLTGSAHLYGERHLAGVLAYVVAAIVFLVAVWVIGKRQMRRPWIVPAVVVLVALAVRVAVAVAFDAPIAGENEAINKQALGVLDGASCCFSHRPMGYPLLLAGAYSLFGVGAATIEGLNVLIATATTALVYDIGRVGWERRVGLLAAAMFAVTPSQVLLVLPPLTEPLYTLAICAVIRLAIVPAPRAGPASSGIALAVGQYARATAAPLLAPLVLLPLLTGMPLIAWLRRSAILVACFLVLLAPVAWYNLQAHGDLSISTSAYAGWTAFVGANQANDGRWNQADSTIFAELPGSSAWDKSERAGELAIERIRADPAGYLRLQPRKFDVMWADESYAASYAFSPVGSAADANTRSGWLLGQLFYAPLIVLALVGALAERWRPRPVTLLIVMFVTSVALVHTVAEVHSRYHAYLVPTFALLAAAGVSAIATRVGWRRGRSLESGL